MRREERWIVMVVKDGARRVDPSVSRTGMLGSNRAPARAASGKKDQEPSDGLRDRTAVIARFEILAEFSVRPATTAMTANDSGAQVEKSGFP